MACTDMAFETPNDRHSGTISSTAEEAPTAHSMGELSEAILDIGDVAGGPAAGEARGYRP